MSAELRERRNVEIARLERFAKLPYHGRAVSMWVDFMRDDVRLAGCYRQSVAAVLVAGKWRNKAHPIAWVRQVAEAEAVKAFGVPDVLDLLPRVSAIDRDGSPMSDDAIIDGQTYDDGLSDIDRWPVAPDVVAEDGINWPRVFQKAGLDSWEEQVFIETKLRGVSRDALVKRQVDDKSRKAIQSAARRLLRKLPTIIKAVRSPISDESTAPIPKAQRDSDKVRYISPAESLRLAIQREREPRDEY